ncbi:hypothetical protein [Fusobacterium pseudoperiodonticum]|uniref:hypothetical protein n=1 Tax=Fusobacterium pseudoperiodonticum TaxID=2663009 RepID=UPI000C1B2C58|nr:hypothetical protein [Fusobacterium pseudoperiodonticum]ATV57247.1 hypothetical protein CTM68_05915 [Fusobacterium pseudoperiodonticum]ATV64883.1 hypothetical protein CTM78_11210 [Fusobacterium pseudoperiodonticum]PIM76885.1 hypothetical protein CTM69_08520 [Fusobacterium pseudoperiodonticum]
MRNDVWKRICYGLYIFIGIIYFGYIIDTLLYKFGFEQTAPKIYDNISGAFGGATASIFFIKDDTKKFNIYFLIISIILAIGVYFLIHN